MLRPFDCLTEDDKEIIKQWCINYGNAEPRDIKTILAVWDKNKKTLFRAFGKQLQISFPIHQKVNSSYRHCKWRKLYSPFLIYDKHDLQTFTPDPRNHVFINCLGQWLQAEYLEKLPLSCLRDITEYTKYCYIEEGKTLSARVFYLDQSKPLNIPAGTKIMRAIRKVLEYYHFPKMETFYQWRDDVSVINTDKEINAELVLSINPVDFITMSDNKSGWTSCMSWIDNGAYSTGTLEMLNSNVAVVAYLRNSQPFTYNGIEIPNKSWRALIFVHKDILLVGKHYPYQSETLAKIVLDKMQNIVKDNLNWKYKYHNQLYQDMIYSYDNRFIREDFERRKTGHKIYTYTNIMYHDILEDHDTDYWCCRNKVEKNLYLSLSGPITCICCGKNITKEEKATFLSTSLKYCNECEAKFKCSGCGLVSEKHAQHFVYFEESIPSGRHQSQGCPDCLIDHYFWDTIDKIAISKTRAQRVGIWHFHLEQHERFIPLTRERISQIEICDPLPYEFTIFYD